MNNGVTKLQEGLIERIYAIIRDDGLHVGERLNEKQLAERLNVSRSPIRAALDVMASRGFVVRRPQRGVELMALPPRDSFAALKESSRDDLLVRIARDRDRGALGDEFSETELIKRYDVPRHVLRNALSALADLDVLERKPGYGWRFLTIWNSEIRGESYGFRLVIEPAAILEPNFAISLDWINEMQCLHEASLHEPWSEASSVAFFEMNAAFHEGICAASGNRFFRESMRRQNMLRRLSNYSWEYGFDRVRSNYAEHIAILEQLKAGDRELAALLMKRHLESSERLMPAVLPT